MRPTLRAELAEHENALDNWLHDNGLDDYGTPWWAVAMLDLEGGSDESRVRRMRLGGRKPSLLTTDAYWETWARIVQRARDTVMQQPIEQWRKLAYQGIDKDTYKPNEKTQQIWDAALKSPRSFVEWIGLSDDQGNQVHFKDFHTQTVDGMRQTPFFVALLPLEHGKTWNSSQVVPLMDWAEFRNCTQGRIYLDNDTIAKWVARLKQQVEFNEALHQMFPWVRRPKRDDSSKVWNETSFSIGGREIADASFKAMTVSAGRMGFRFHRTGVDDIVTSTQCESQVIQDKNWFYVQAGPMTFPQTVQGGFKSRYGTVFPSFYLDGTIFAPGDANVRALEQVRGEKEKGNKDYSYKVFDIYPRGGKHPDRVLWPEYKDAKAVQDMRERLGERVFLMRCRNMLMYEGLHTFPEKLVRAAEMDGTEGKPAYTFGEVPDNCVLAIGFDPASGKFGRQIANPAAFLYGLRAANIVEQVHNLGPFATDAQIAQAREIVQHHWIKWQTMPGFSMPRQCDLLIDWARQFMCPVVVEDNQTQISFADYITKTAPDVQVITRTTTQNVRDPNQGVEQFGPLFSNHMIVIHAHEAPPNELIGLRKELLQYVPGNKKRLKDRIMAAWIARHQLQLSRDQGSQIEIKQYTPVYARSRYQRFAYRNHIDLSGRY